MSNLTNPLRTGAALAGLAIAAAACTIDVDLGGEEGSGVAETVSYDFDDFDRVSISAAFRADITVVDGPASVEVTVDDNLVDDLEVELDGDRLEIGWDRGSRRPDVTPTATISLPSLVELDLSGASSAGVTGVDADDLELEASGASTIEVDGSAERVTVDGSGASTVSFEGSIGELILDLSGASNADLDRATVGSAAVDLSGASRAAFDRVERVDGDLSGASRLSVPDGAEVNVSASGGSSIGRD